MDDNSPHSVSPRRNSPYLRQLALQCAAASIVLGIAWPYCLLRRQTLPWFESSLLIGALAFLFSSLSAQYWWWRVIHASFAPATVLFSGLNVAPEWYLATFVLMFLVYRGAVTSQVPLYISSLGAIRALSELLADVPARKIIDLGAGTGSVASALARTRRDVQVFGIENSFLPWAIGFFRTARLKNCHWSLGSFWQVPLADCDVVYAFLSPAPMSDLWLKAKREMRPGTLFISNGFEVPDVTADAEIEVADSGKTRLYCYRL
ncbi:MAG: class I SAM-dependent methyltransferase [Candidatus Accumulibacter sp.]|jgi:SAM-dependent methyltransferase|nr:class I SAM-dependent methyltransferase [Accumulibacter sp.]